MVSEETETIMSSTPSGPDPSAKKITLYECLFFNCPCGHTQYTHWVAEELSSKHIDRIRGKGKAIVKNYWYLRPPKMVTCASCGAKHQCESFIES